MPNKILNSKQIKDTLQPMGSDKNKKDFIKAYGFLPKSPDKERDNWEQQKWNVNHKKV